MRLTHLWNRIHSLRAANYTYKQISDLFTEENVPTVSTTGKWWGQTVRQFYVVHKPKRGNMITNLDQLETIKLAKERFDGAEPPSLNTISSVLPYLEFVSTNDMIDVDELSNRVELSRNTLVKVLPILADSGIILQTNNKKRGHRKFFLDTELGAEGVANDNASRERKRKEYVRISPDRYESLLEAERLLESLASRSVTASLS